MTLRVTLRVRVHGEYGLSMEVSWDGTSVVAQAEQATCRVGVKTSQAQGGGGLAQAKSPSVLQPMALLSGAGRASRRLIDVTSRVKEESIRPCCS